MEPTIILFLVLICVLAAHLWHVMALLKTWNYQQQTLLIAVQNLWGAYGDIFKTSLEAMKDGEVMADAEDDEDESEV